MNMKRLLTLVAFFATLQASAQQVNPVPDYVFANRMSAGRNTVTDTAAYLSIGPRYGATRGMMPPMVVDTSSFSANKRNGLLIFSVQKNKFLYWDSVGVKWAEMAGTAGTALTSADTAALLSTRAWRQKGIDSLAAIRVAGSGTTNYVSKFTATRAVGNSQIFDDGTGVVLGNNIVNANTSFEVYKNVNDLVKLVLNNPNTGSSAYSDFEIRTSNVASSGMRVMAMGSGWTTVQGFVQSAGILNADVNMTGGMSIMTRANAPIRFYTNGAANERARINESGELIVGTITDNGNYTLQNNGNTYLSGNVDVNNAAIILSNNRFLSGRNAANTLSVRLIGRDASDRVIIDQDGYGTTIGNGSYILLNPLTGGKVGIGSNVIPTYTLDITGSFRTTDSSFFNTTGGESYFGTTTDAGDYRLQVSGSIYNTGSITTGAPSGGSIKPWKIGEAATVSPTSPNRTLRVEVDGVVYYIHAKTTND